MSEADTKAAVQALGDTMSGKTVTPKVVAASGSPMQLNEWTEDNANFDFEEDFQNEIAALTAMDPNFIRRTRDCIQPGHFEDVGNAYLVNIAQTYFDQYNRLPGKASIWAQLIRDAIESKQLRKNFKDAVVDAFKRAKSSDLSDGDYAMDKITRFTKHQDIMSGLNECIDLASKGDWEGIERRMSKAFMQGAKGEYTEADYWSDLDKRTKLRKDIASGLIKPTGIPLGIPKIDNILYHKGLGRKEMTVLMAGAKKGKSMGLGDWALRFSKQGFNVLYATLEVSVDIIGDRMDANISRTDMDDLNTMINDVASKVQKISDAPKKPGVLKLVEFPSGSLSPKGLQAYIERHKAEGIKFDVVVVDYADIMAPDNPTSDSQENSKQVWLGLRGIASRENVVMLTATQTNREGFKSDTAKAEHAADDFNKIRIADLVISINRTDQEREDNEARLFFAASRNQAGEFCIHIKQSLSKMGFIDKVLKVA